LVHASSTVTDAVDTAAAAADSEFVTRNGANDGMVVEEKEGTTAQISSASEVPHSISAMSTAVESVMVMMCWCCAAGGPAAPAAAAAKILLEGKPTGQTAIFNTDSDIHERGGRSKIWREIWYEPTRLINFHCLFGG